MTGTFIPHKTAGDPENTHQLFVSAKLSHLTQTVQLAYFKGLTTPFL